MKNREFDITIIRKYLKGELDAKAMHELEMQAEQDPQLRDVMMGMEMASLEEHEANLDALRDRIDQRSQSEDNIKKVISLKFWGIAASVVLVMVIAGLWVIRDKASDVRVAQQEVSHTAIPSDSSSRNQRSEPLIAQRSTKTPAAASVETKKAAQPSPVPSPPPQKEQKDTFGEKELAYAPMEKLEEPSAAISSMDSKRASRLSSKSARPQAESLSRIHKKEQALGGSKKVDENNESKIIGGDNNNEKDMKQARPSIGWDAYHSYLRKQIALEDERGEVIVAFKVDPDGNPSSIRVIEEGSNEINEKAIELIRNGPKWVAVGDSAGNEIEIKIVFE